MTYLVIVDIGEHSGFIREFDESQWFSSSNPNGFSTTDVCGSHGHILSEHGSKDEARAALAEFLECDSVESNSYCYSHNPNGR